MSSPGTPWPPASLASPTTSCCAWSSTPSQPARCSWHLPLRECGGWSFPARLLCHADLPFPRAWHAGARGARRPAARQPHSSTACRPARNAVASSWAALRDRTIPMAKAICRVAASWVSATGCWRCCPSRTRRPTTPTTPALSIRSTGLPDYTVARPACRHSLSPADNPLVLFNLDVALEWDASKDTNYLTQLQYDLNRTSELLYDWSNGQAALGRIRIFHDAAPPAGVTASSPGSTATSASTPPTRCTPTPSRAASSRDRVERDRAQRQDRSSTPPAWCTSAQSGTATPTPPPWATTGRGRWRTSWATISSSSTTTTSARRRRQRAVHLLRPGHRLPRRHERPLHRLPGQVPARSPAGCPAAPAPTRSSPGPLRLGDHRRPLSLAASARVPIQQVNPGPSGQRLAFTQFEVVPPPAAAADRQTLGLPIFTISTAGGGAYQPSPDAHAFLLQDARLVELAHLRSTSSSPAAPAAATRSACSSPTTSAPAVSPPHLASTNSWSSLCPTGSRRSFSRPSPHAPSPSRWPVSQGLALKAQLYPRDGDATAADRPGARRRGYAATFDLAEPVFEGSLRIWDANNPLRQVITDFVLGSNPTRWDSRDARWRARLARWRARLAPVISSGGKVAVLGDNVDFGSEDWVFSLQAATALPDLPDLGDTHRPGLLAARQRQRPQPRQHRHQLQLRPPRRARRPGVRPARLLLERQRLDAARHQHQPDQGIASAPTQGPASTSSSPLSRSRCRVLAGTISPTPSWEVPRR